MKRTIALLLAILGVAGGHQGAAQPDIPFAVDEVAPGNFVHYGTLDDRTPANLGDQANIGFIVGSQCVAVVDAGGSLPVGQKLRQAIRARTSLPICYVILTHVHPDHMFGAAAFRADNPTYVGHHNLPRAMQQRGKFYFNTLKRDLGDLAEGSEVIPPTLLVQDELKLDLGARSLALRAWPIAHTDNDLTIFDVETQTLWASDLLFLQHTPVVDGSITGFLSVLDRLAAILAQHYVAGHGRTDLRWPQALGPERHYLQLIVDETRRALKQRKSIQDAVDTVGLSEEKNWLNFDQFHRRNVTQAYTELEWED
ncbi:MAG TPA: quinoprotein relay system zinc metallohydrolase 2 [Burkholderiales bacterium]|nr:quinoprotein relay system zinc metallohydrolase 2 [Burkholderiales bacterium]